MFNKINTHVFSDPHRDVLMFNATAQLLSLIQRGVTQVEYSSKMSSRSPPPLNAKVSQMKLTGFPLYSTYSSSSLSISLGNDKQYSPNSSEVIIIAQCKTASIYYYSIFITCISLYFCFISDFSTNLKEKYKNITKNTKWYMYI